MWNIDENTGYLKLPANDIDWIAKNIFNVEINHDINSSYYYYEDNFYYMEGGFGGAGWHIVEIDESKQLDDGKYNITFIVYSMWADELIDTEKKYCIADLKMIDGKKYWTFYKIEKN